MSIDTGGSEEVTLPEPDACKNAKQYALKRLDRATEPVRPSQLADEYGCSSSHMRHVLGELQGVGAVKRVERGEYVSNSVNQPGGDTSEEGDGDSTEEPSEMGDILSDSDERPSVDGRPQSEDLDGTAGSRGTDGDAGYECPEDGCDYLGESVAAVRSHINGKSLVPDHGDWADLADAVREQVEDDDEQDDRADQDESVDESEPWGIPIPVSEQTAILAALAVVALLLFIAYLRADDGGGEAAQDDETDAEAAHSETPFATAEGIAEVFED